MRSMDFLGFDCQKSDFSFSLCREISILLLTSRNFFCFGFSAASARRRPGLFEGLEDDLVGLKSTLVFLVMLGPLRNVILGCGPRIW